MNMSTILTDRQTGSVSLRKLPNNYAFNGIDLIKFFCSYLVCAIHITPFTGIDWSYAGYFNYGIQHGIARVAVPFFFTSAGFLLFRKIDINSINKERIKKYCYKMIFLLGVWSILLFMGNTTQLWYLGGTVIVIALLYVLLKKKVSFLKIGLIAGLLYSIGLLLDSYSGFLRIISQKTGLSFINDFVSFFNEDISRTLRLGLFSALIFFFMGVLFVYKTIKMKMWVSYAGLLFSVMILLVETFAIKHLSKPYDHNLFVSLIPATFFLFYIATHIQLKNRKIYKTLRELGVLVFFTHLFVCKAMELIFKQINLYIGIDLSGLLFVSVIILTTLLSIGIRALSHKKRFNVLKRLYS